MSRRKKNGTTSVRKQTIENFWKASPLGEYLHIKVDDKETCFACGKATLTDRAHILANFYEGTPNKENLHLLCSKCHHESENMMGMSYWVWLLTKSFLYERGHITPLEYDEYNRGKWDYFPMKTETFDKLYQHQDMYCHYLMNVDGQWAGNHWGRILVNYGRLGEYNSILESRGLKTVNFDIPLIIDTLWKKIGGLDFYTMFSHLFDFILDIDECHEKQKIEISNENWRRIRNAMDGKI